MASNIPIKLTGDNKSALAAITGVQKGLGTLGTGVDNLNKKMVAFTNALVGVGIIAFTKSLLTSAELLDEMAESFDTTSGRILEMGVAAAASGSSLEGLNNMLFRMQNNISAAIEGNGEMQKALTSVGISLSDVQRLRPDEIFNKIAVALSKITNPLERTRLQTELFSKASKGFSAASYVAEIEKLYGTMDKYTQSTADAARISDSLGMFLTLVKAEFLALLQPILSLVMPLTETGAAMGRAAVAAKVLLGALGLFVGAQIINGIMSIVGGLKSLASFMGLAAVVTKAETRETIINAGAKEFLKASVAQLGYAEERLAITTARLSALEKDATATAAALTRARKAQTYATAELKIANDAMTLAAGRAGITLAAAGGNAAKTTGIFRTLTGVLFGVSFGIAAIVRSFGYIALVLGAVTILWEAFGDILTRWATGTVNFVIEKFSALVDFLKKVGRILREVTDAAGLTTAKATAASPGNIGATETPAYAPSLLTQSVGSLGGGFVSKEAKDAEAALGAQLKVMEQQADAAELKNTLTKHGTEFAKLQLDIDKAINDAQAAALKAGLDKSKVDEKGIRSALTRVAIANATGELNDLDLKSQTERNLLLEKDTAEREIQAELMKVKQQYGSLLNKDQLANYESTLRITAAEKERLNIAQALDRLRGKNIPQTTENALAGAALAQTDMEKLQATYDTQSDLLKQALDKNYITQESYQTALNNLQLAQYNGELDLVIRNFDLKEELRQKEINAEAAKYASLLVQQKDFLGQQLFTNTEAKQIALDRANWEKKTDLQKTQAIVQQGADMFNALGAQNKKAFEIAKAFNIANAIMNTFLGASKALAQGGIFGFISAAAIVAAGFAQVAQIRAQTFSGRALGGPVVGGQSYMVGEKGPETFRPSTAGTITPNDKLGGGATNVTFNIVANDTRGFDQLLMERRPLITKIIRDAQLEQGRRTI
jgi:hypothetical protein